MLFFVKTSKTISEVLNAPEFTSLFLSLHITFNFELLTREKLIIHILRRSRVHTTGIYEICIMQIYLNFTELIDI